LHLAEKKWSPNFFGFRFSVKPGTAVPGSPGGAPLVDEQNFWKRGKSAGLAVGLLPVSR